jgi:ABC-type antimicrobial peptide transport system permease subunit
VTGIGLVVGIVGAAFGTRLMGAMLYDVSHLDAITYGTVILVLAVMATVASAVPAVRAARIDPARALRG